ncbi:MAG: hypothetical protein JW850_21695 [Thermoflexales bacterium]|nr:hypothetical protein [Thermoflexales bacterium]
MNKRSQILASIALIGLGSLALACNMSVLLFGVGWGPWRLWPLLVVGAGCALVAPPLLVRGKPALGALFIPGMPVLVTGCILLFCSVFDAWGAWAWLWPQEVLAVAAGFLFAAAYMRQIWLLVPAILIGLNGLLFQFCAITGWWQVWAVLWTIEPLAIGVALLAVNIKQHAAGLWIAGFVLCGLAGLGTLGSLGLVSLSAFFPAWWLWGWIGPGLLILAGLALLAWGLLGRPVTLSASAD